MCTSPHSGISGMFLQVCCNFVRPHKVYYAAFGWETFSAICARMKPLLPGVLAILLLAQLGVGQQSCPGAGPSCACATSPPDSESSDGTAPPAGSRDFFTPTGDYQSPSSAGTPIRPGNAQQSPAWVGAAMVSSSDDAVVLVRLEPLHEVALPLSRPHRMLCCTSDAPCM